MSRPMHKRVLSVVLDAEKIRETVHRHGSDAYRYTGRGHCPVTFRDAFYSTPEGETVGWMNKFPLDVHGTACMALFFDYLRDDRHGQRAVTWAPIVFAGEVLGGCYCRGKHPVCHAETWVRLGDGEKLADIRADVLARIVPKAAPKQGGLFA